MKIKHLVDFVFQDGTISMHVTAVEYQSSSRPSRYNISYHNTMRQETHHVEQQSSRTECMAVGLRKRKEMLEDISTIWKDLAK